MMSSTLTATIETPVWLAALVVIAVPALAAWLLHRHSEVAGEQDHREKRLDDLHRLLAAADDEFARRQIRDSFDRAAGAQ